MNKRAKFYNVDERGPPLNNKPGYVQAQKGMKDVQKLTCENAGENITALVSCNDEGNSYSPSLVCIFIRVNKNVDWEDKMSLGRKSHHM